jgi:hypothetical protein
VLSCASGNSRNQDTQEIKALKESVCHPLIGRSPAVSETPSPSLLVLWCSWQFILCGARASKSTSLSGPKSLGCLRSFRLVFLLRSLWPLHLTAYSNPTLNMLKRYQPGQRTQGVPRDIAFRRLFAMYDSHKLLACKALVSEFAMSTGTCNGSSNT